MMAVLNAVETAEDLARFDWCLDTSRDLLGIAFRLMIMFLKFPQPMRDAATNN